MPYSKTLQITLGGGPLVGHQLGAIGVACGAFIERLKGKSAPVEWDIDSVSAAFFSGRQATVIELGACNALLERLAGGDLWSGRVSFPLVKLMSKSAGHVRRSPREALAHYELKESAWSWIQTVDGSCSVDTEVSAPGCPWGIWDAYAQSGPEVVRIECGTTPPWRMEGLGNHFAAFMVVPFCYYGQSECQAYCFAPSGEHDIQKAHECAIHV